jgi:hypothetical protein
MKKHRGNENKAYIEGMRQIRRSGAAGPHDSRQRGLRDRKGAKRHAIRDASY